MPKNLELKIKIKSIEEKKKLLEAIGAEYKGILDQKDVYYQFEKGLLKLRAENGRSELILYNRNEAAADRFSSYEILSVDNEKAEDFLPKIFNVQTVVEKKRLLYMYDNTRIHLDEVKHLGEYLELETLMIKDKSDAKRRFEKIIELLNLNLDDQIRSSYSKMLIEKNDLYKRKN